MTDGTLVFDPLDVEGTACKALVSIANSLAILSDQTDQLSPITEAAFILATYEDDSPQEEINTRPKGAVS